MSGLADTAIAAWAVDCDTVHRHALPI